MSKAEEKALIDEIQEDAAELTADVEQLEEVVEGEVLPSEQGFPAGTKFYFSTISALSIYVDGDPQHVVRFSPYEETYQGWPRKVGYLATANKRAQEVLATDINVEELDRSAYLKATGKGAKPLGLPFAG